MLRDILVPVDGSEGSAHAARFGAFLAKETGASLTFLYVYDVQTAGAIGLARSGREEVEEIARRVAKGSFDRADEESKEFHVEAHYETRFGHPAEEIITYARQTHPQLIIMGSRGLSPVRELLVGSVSDQVLRHAPCPVTVVR